MLKEKNDTIFHKLAFNIAMCSKVIFNNGDASLTKVWHRWIFAVQEATPFCQDGVQSVINEQQLFSEK